MRDPRTIIADNVARVCALVANAANRSGRNPASVEIVAVSKYVDAPTTALLLDVGCQTLGESRPQQLWEKASTPELAAARWHLVGRLQRNKIRRTLPLVELIHGVDSERLLAAIDEQSVELDLSPQVLLEVNCSGDQAKQGFSPDALHRVTSLLTQLRRVQVTGLMTMAPLDGGEPAARACFAALRNLRDELGPTLSASTALRELSMGMSGDFEAAIAEGATMVRIGSLLFEGLQE